LRQKYLERCHDGHQGVSKCRRRAQQLFWWPGCSKDIADFVSNCDVCIKASHIRHQPMYESELPDGPWVEVATDVFEFRNGLYLLMVDYYSKWIEVRRLISQTSSCVIDVLSSVFAALGVPEVVRSDNGPCYSSRAFKQFADEWGFEHRTSSPRYPESNGLAERSVRTVKSMWRKSDSKERALLAYRSTPLSSGFSPGELMYGRSMRSILGNTGSRSVDYELYESISGSMMAEARRRWNIKHRAKALPELESGVKVWVKAPLDKGSEGVVIEKDVSPDSYWVEVGECILRRNRKHLFPLTGLSVKNSSDSSILPLALEGDDDCVAVPAGGRSVGDSTSVLDTNVDLFDDSDDGSEVTEYYLPSLEGDSLVSDSSQSGVQYDEGVEVNAEVASGTENTSVGSEESVIVEGSNNRVLPVVSTKGRVVKPKKDGDYVYY
jgi:hypothetical protein